jgi:hypothetical protein
MVISVSGTFLRPRALDTVGTFHASFCVPDSSDPARSAGIYIIREVSGTFSATRGSSPPSRLAPTGVESITTAPRKPT